MDQAPSLGAVQAQLESLLPEFLEPFTAPEDRINRLLAKCRSFQDDVLRLANALPTFPDADRQRLFRSARKAAKQLAGLDAHITAYGASVASGQIEAGALLLNCCLHLSPTAADCAIGVRFVFGAGLGALLSVTSAFQQGGRVTVHLINHLGVQLALVAQLATAALKPDVPGFLPDLARHHMPANALTDWVQAVVAAAQVVHRRPQELSFNPEVLRSKVAGHLAVILTALSLVPQLNNHLGAIRARTQLCQDIQQLFIRAVSAAAVASQLPAEQQPSSVNWQHLGTMANALCSGVLGEAAQSQLLGPNAARDSAAAVTIARVLRASSLLLQQLPMGTPITPGDQQPQPTQQQQQQHWCSLNTWGPWIFAGLQAWSAGLQANLLVEQRKLGMRLDAQQVERLAQQQLPLVSRLLQLLRHAVSEVQAGQMHWRPLKWLLASCLGTLQLLGVVAQVDCKPRLPRAPLGGPPPAVIALPGGLLAWCRAAADAFQLLPLLPAATAELRLTDPAGEVCAVVGGFLSLEETEAEVTCSVVNLALLAGTICHNALVGCRGEDGDVIAAAVPRLVPELNVPQSASELRLALWRLSTAGCRLFQWTETGASKPQAEVLQPPSLLPLVLFPLMSAANLHIILSSLTSSSNGASSAETLSPAKLEQPRWLQGICAASWEAMRVLLPHLPLDLCDHGLLRDLIGGLLCLANWSPSSVTLTPDFRGFLVNTIMAVVSTGHLEWLPNVVGSLLGGMQPKRSAALLLGGRSGAALAVTAGVLADMLKEGHMHLVDYATQYTCELIENVRDAANDALAAAKEHGQGSLEEQQLLSALRQRLAAADEALGPGGGVRQLLWAKVKCADAASGGTLTSTVQIRVGAGEAESAQQKAPAYNKVAEAAALTAASAEIATHVEGAIEGGAAVASTQAQRAFWQLLQQEFLPPAVCQLAEALLAWWRRAEQRQAIQLELAQAAATRSCAYLRCSNLAAAGGPEAGQGTGSKVCGGCKAVWYCGTACSHADWRRGGHRGVCAELAAMRLAKKQKRTQEGQLK